MICRFQSITMHRRHGCNRSQKRLALRLSWLTGGQRKATGLNIHKICRGWIRTSDLLLMRQTSRPLLYTAKFPVHSFGLRAAIKFVAFDLVGIKLASGFECFAL